MGGKTSREKPAGAARKGKARGRLWPRNRWLRRLLIGVAVVFVALPAGLTLLYAVAPPPITPLMVIRVFEGEGLAKDWVPLAEISPHVPRAVIAAEDNRFCEHGGFDFEAI